MVRKLNLLGFILVSCLFFLMQGADDNGGADNNNGNEEGESAGPNGVNNEMQSLLALFREVLTLSLSSDEEVRRRLSDFTHADQELDWLSRERGASVGGMYVCLFGRLTEHKEVLDQSGKAIKQLQESSQRSEGKLDRLLKHFEQADADRVEQGNKFNAMLEELTQLKKSDAQQNDDLQGFAVFAGAISSSFSLLNERGKLQEDYQELTLGALRDQQKELQEGRDEQQCRLLLIEGKVADLKQCFELLPKGDITPDPSVC